MKFTNYLTKLVTKYMSFHDKFFVDLDNEQKLEVFLGLFKPTSDYIVVTRESYCAGCEAAYTLCNSHNDDNAMVAAGGNSWWAWRTYI